MKVISAERINHRIIQVHVNLDALENVALKASIENGTAEDLLGDWFNESFDKEDHRIKAEFSIKNSDGSAFALLKVYEIEPDEFE